MRYSRIYEIIVAYPKVVITKTKHEDYQYEGIQIIDLANWLSE